jgi:putative Holliday junction resolvase
MGRILGLDMGEKFIGVALSDPSKKIAFGLETYQSKGFENDRHYLQCLIDKYEVESVVVGLPMQLNGNIGVQAEKILSFVNRLGEFLPCPILTWDERLTTRQAEKTLLEADISRKRRKRIINKLAAQLILQNYLDSECNSFTEANFDTP